MTIFRFKGEAMTKDAKALFAELNRIATADGWFQQRRRSMIGVFKSKATDEERAAMLAAIKERRPKI